MTSNAPQWQVFSVMRRAVLLDPLGDAPSLLFYIRLSIFCGPFIQPGYANILS